LIGVDRSGGVVVTGDFSGSMRVGKTVLESAGGRDIVLFRLAKRRSPRRLSR
jgi:hypothetical protein